MRRFRWPVVVLLVLVIGLPFLLAALGVRIPWLSRSSRLPEPSGVPSGDQEVAWISPPTDAAAWDDFVTGLKRAEMRVPGLIVNVSDAYPEQTTAVPEVVVTRPPYPGKLRYRWYKTSSEATLHDWVTALAHRDPAPLALVGGTSSDRAVELATALRSQSGWHGDPPLLLITTATIDRVQVNPNDPEWFAQPGEQLLLTALHPGRTFRFCFTNSQMAEAVTDYLTHDPTLFPGRGGWPGFLASTAAAAGPWPAVGSLAELAGSGPLVFTLQWEDDPFSEDLADYFKEAIYKRFTCRADPLNPGRPANAPVFTERNRIPFSIGGFARPNAGEAEAVREIARQLGTSSGRSVLIIPTGSAAPARRVLLALSERVPVAGRRLVAVTGDGISVNTLYRDAEFAWPARSIPIPMVMFAHQNPFGYDKPGGPPPPRGYALDPASRSGTQDILVYTDIGVSLGEAVFPNGGTNMARRADEVANRLRDPATTLFDQHGNRRGGKGEHVVVLRPTQRYGADLSKLRPEAVIEVYRRGEGPAAWVRVRVEEVRPEKQENGRPTE